MGQRTGRYVDLPQIVCLIPFSDMQLGRVQDARRVISRVSVTQGNVNRRGLVKRCVKSIQAAFPSLPFDIVSITPFRQRLPV
jgi:hypothetical protein